MPCSEPNYPELRKHREAAVPLLCEAIRVLMRADLMKGMSPEFIDWAAVHLTLDRLRDGPDGYEAAELLERIARTKKAKGK